MNDLDISDDLFDPKWTSDEKPDVLLTVKDDEIKVEKYISEEEQKRLDEVAKGEEGNHWYFSHILLRKVVSYIVTFSVAKLIIQKSINCESSVHLSGGAFSDTN